MDGAQPDFTDNSGGHITVHLVDREDTCLLYTSDPADERSSVDLGGRRIIKKKTNEHTHHRIRNHKPHTAR